MLPADQGELGVADECMRAGAGTGVEPLAGDEGSQEQLGHVLRQRGDRREDQGRRSTQKDRHRQVLAQGLGASVMESAALADLPVHPGACRVVHLHPVDAQVGDLGFRMLGVDQGQREERSSVLRPGGQRRPGESSHNPVP